MNSILRGSPGEICYARAVEHRLCRRASDVDACTSDVLAFNDGGLASGLCQGFGERSAALTRANNNRVILFKIWHCLPPGSRAISITNQITVRRLRNLSPSQSVMITST